MSLLHFFACSILADIHLFKVRERLDQTDLESLFNIWQDSLTAQAATYVYVHF